MELKAQIIDIAPDNSSIADNAFEEMYITVRDKEGRLYTDRQLKHLPDIDASHKYAKEWKLRKQSAEQLVDFLKGRNRPLKILEVGCGNGWLAAKLAGIPGSKVTGLDPNRVEIDQAKRVFSKTNLHFIHGAFRRFIFDSATKFDVIVFAASIQYFPSLDDVLNDAFALLATDGRIHILDSPFYHTDELNTAAERSLNYYASLGFPQMARYYHHHGLKQVMQFKHKTMYDPTKLLNKLTNKGIFYWLKLKP